MHQNVGPTIPRDTSTFFRRTPRRVSSSLSDPRKSSAMPAPAQDFGGGPTSCPARYPTLATADAIMPLTMTIDETGTHRRPTTIDRHLFLLCHKNTTSPIIKI